jgi:histidinol dehydrogenase
LKKQLAYWKGDCLVNSESLTTEQAIMPFWVGDEALAFVAKHVKQLPFLEVSPQAVAVRERVSGIIQQVKQQGDAVLYDLAAHFGDSLQANDPIAIPSSLWREAYESLPVTTQAVLKEVTANIQGFAQAILDTLPKGQQIWQHPHAGYQTSFSFSPVVSAGCYVPAGRYPLVSSALMTAVTAKVAGVNRVVLACPNPPAEVLAVAHLLNVDAVYKVGGAQALAALAIGTEQIPAVDMIVGPGNAYVAEAKRQLLGTVGIDLLAGPSEVVVVADETANIDLVVADLLAQAEHDPEARVYLLTPCETFARSVQQALLPTWGKLGLPSFVKDDSLVGSAILVLPSLQACVEASNQLAPEHLQLHGASVEALADAFKHYGCLFKGQWATVAFGDYTAGPNHTLPTGRSARFSSGLSPLAFLRLQNTVQLEAPNAYLAEKTQAMARLEGLTAHGYSAQLRG